MNVHLKINIGMEGPPQCKLKTIVLLQKKLHPIYAIVVFVYIMHFRHVILKEIKVFIFFFSHFSKKI